MKISIYAIVPINGNDENPPLYIGSTQNLKKRNIQHKCYCNNPNDKAYNKPLYKYIRANGNLDAFIMVELVSEDVETKQDALKLERTYINLLKPTLNKYIPGRTRKEYRDENSEAIKQQFKELNYKRIICPHCNVAIMKGNKTNHNRSQKHQNNIKNQENTE